MLLPLRTRRYRQPLGGASTGDTWGSLGGDRQALTLEIKGHASSEFPHDDVQLERALGNLIRNGIEAIPSQRTIDVPGRVIVTVADGVDGNVVLSVEDDGPGLSIEPGEWSAGRSTKARGSGLGLYIASKIARGHGGRLNVSKSSRLGGALLSIDLPITPFRA